MSIAGYAVAQATEDPRNTEYRIFAQVTRALMEVGERNSLDRGFRDAIEWNRRLWNALEIDLASEKNLLPDALKAQIISVAMWVEKHSARTLRGEAAVEPLITINRAIMAGDGESGVTVMKMDEGLDTGAIATEDRAMIERVRIGADMTAGELHDALSRLGADLMGRALSALERGTLSFKPQPADGVTYAAKIDKAETRIDWAKPWQAVHGHIRGLSPFPGAWCEMGGDRVKVLRTTRGEGSGAPGLVLDDRLSVACGDGAVRIVELQKAGGKPLRAEEFLRGAAVAPGTRLG